jgi:hypothetical protein
MSETAKTLTFIAIALVALTAGWVTRPSSTELDVDSLIGADLTPEFSDPADAKRLRIAEFNEASATLRQFEVAEEDGLWTIPSKNGYPADADRQMAEAATAVMGRKILAVQSESAADHEQYGVIDPLSPKLEAGQKGVGERVTISDINDKPLVDVIIGHEVKDATNNQHFIRKAGQDVTYVAEVDTTRLSTGFEDWIEKDLLKLNAFDIQDVQINDYSAELVPVMTNEGPRIQVAWDPRSELKLAYDEKDSKWTATELKQFDKGTETYTEFKVSDDQELNAEKLDALKTALDDLAIVDVDKKPAGLSADLKAGGDFLGNAEARADLRQLGFATIPARSGDGQDLISSEGEVIVTMKDGVEYVLRFGDLRMDSTATSSEKTDADPPADATAADKAKAGDKSVQRYLFAMARFNEAAVKKPVLEELPPLPEENVAPAATEAPAAAEPASEPAATEPTEEEEEEEEINEAAASDPASPEASTLQRAGESEPAPAASESQPESTDPTDTSSAAPTDVNATPEPKHSPEYERILAERKRIETDNQRKLDEYNALLEKGRQQVKELNLRFGDWYFVVSNDTFQKVRLNRNDVIKKKDAPGEPASAGGQNNPAGLPGGAIPGFPSLPGAPQQ